MDRTAGETSQYNGLHERACQFVHEHNGAVHEDSLVHHVFGKSANPDLWRPLIRQVLGDSSELRLRGDGFWWFPVRSNYASSSGLFDTEFVCVDVETTGLRPFQHRIIEIGAVRFVNGRPEDSISILINPERRVPAYVRKLTGIDDDMLVESPLFADVADDVLAFIQDSPLVGYNTGFDLSFLNMELKRIGRPRIVNDQYDVLPVASRVMAGTRSRGLESLARELGVEPTRSHRALDDAMTTGRALIALAPRLHEAGIEKLEDLERFRRERRVARDASEASGRGRSLLKPEHLDSAPSSPGVYLMRSAAGRIIYIGKAKDLRARIRSYYSQPLGYTRKMDGLIETIDQIETVETGSELAALLLEAQLIRRYRPQFNRQLRTSENYPYIKVDVSNPWPRVSLAKNAADDGACYFGPYRASRAARATVDALNDIFPLRTCTRGFRDQRSYGSPCIARDLGQCLGPCTGQANADEYRGHVRSVIKFLDGEFEPVIDRLHAQLEETAQRLDFERAAVIRNRIERVQDLASAQRLLASATERSLLAIVLDGPASAYREIMLVIEGRPWSRTLLIEQDSREAVVKRLEQSLARSKRGKFGPIQQQDLDTVQIVERWVRANWGHPSIISLDPQAPDLDFLVAHAQCVELIR